MAGIEEEIPDDAQAFHFSTDAFREHERIDAWREAFIAVLSHELRTPITTILGASAVLTRPSDPGHDERRQELLGDIASEAARLDRIVSDLVVLSRSERGVLESVCEPMGLHHVLRSIVEGESRRWPAVSFRLEAERPHPVVLAEETYVEQAVRNMLGNAAKYGRPDGEVLRAHDPEQPDPVRRLRTRRRREHEEHLQLVLRDERLAVDLDLPHHRVHERLVVHEPARDLLPVPERHELRARAGQDPHQLARARRRSLASA
jgi:signal transduction histidine kinase